MSSPREKKIKVGFITSLTGAYASSSQNQLLGARLAIDKANKSGGVLGRKVELIVADDKLNNNLAGKRAVELIEGRKVDFLLGSMSAATQIPMNKEARKRKTIFVSLAQSNEITNNKHLGPYTFHEAMTPQMNAQSISRWVFGNLSNSWFLLVVDYEWGHQNRDVCLEFAEKNKVKIKGVIKFPLGSGRFTQYFPKILRSKAETLIVASWGTDQLAFVDQAAKGGLKKKLSIVNTLSELTIAQKMDPSAAAGMYWGANFYWGLSEQIPSARQFVNDFKKAFKVFPTGYAGYAYSGVKELLWALEQSKEYPVQPDKITALLEARTYDHYKGKQWWRPCDHQSFQDLYILKFKGPEERKGPNDFAEVLGSVSWDMGIERTCEELGHKEHLWGHALKKTL